MGLLTKAGLLHLIPLFKSWVKSDFEEFKTILTKDNVLRGEIRIKACAVWDTVGSIGKPRIAIFSQPGPKHLEFVNSELCPNIDNAFQALALHEHRRPFRPILWQSAPATQNLKQCWFLGFHGDVGGGRTDGALAHFPLVWMIDQLKDFLDFDVKSLWISGLAGQRDRAFKNNAQHPGGKIRIEECDKIALTILVDTVKDTKSSIHRLGGDHVRQPRLHFWDKEGIQVSKKLDAESSKETLHYSVRILLQEEVMSVPLGLEMSKCEDIGGSCQWTIESREGSKPEYLMKEENFTDDEFNLLRLWLDSEKSYLTSETDVGVTRAEINRAMPGNSSLLGIVSQWHASGYHEKKINKSYGVKNFLKSRLK